MTDAVYLDNNATSAIDEPVLAAMVSALLQVGNASSSHELGRDAKAKVEVARSQVADLAGCSPAEVVFTSGATEANNLAVKGTTILAPVPHPSTTRRDEVVVAATEHPSVQESVDSLLRFGYKVIRIGVDEAGEINLHELRSVVSERTALVSIMAANNETGVTSPVEEIVEVGHRVGALVHTDATQLMTWGRPGAAIAEADLVSLSAHKMHGPQGVGALIVRRAARRHVGPAAHGGGHERGLRSGTLNVAGIIGLGVAAKLSLSLGPSMATPTQRRRDLLESMLSEALGPEMVALNGHRERRLPGTLNVSILGIDAEALVATTRGVAMSTGSACSAGVPGPSAVLRAMTLSDERCASAVRLSLSRMTTDREIAIAADTIVRSAAALRSRMSGAAAR